MTGDSGADGSGRPQEGKRRPQDGEQRPQDGERHPEEGKRFIRGRQFVRARRGVLAVGTVVALLAAGLGTWATDTWPFDSRDRYCWGAWEQDSGPGILGDEAFDGDGGRSRTSRGTAPTAAKPRGTCVLAVRSTHTFSDGDKGVQDTNVTVTYGPAPKGAAERVEWIGRFLGDRAMPLPEGLPGAVDGRHGLLVLPKRCDSRDGRPTAVTLEAVDRAPDDVIGGTDLGGADAVVELLLAAAEKGMKATGCAPDEPVRVTSPVLRLPERQDTTLFGPACRIPGLDVEAGVDKDTALRMQAQVGAVTGDLQSCSVTIGRSVRVGEREDTRVFDALMVRAPRLGALLDGVTGRAAPARGWRGTGVFTDDYQVVRAGCAGRPTTFLLLGSPTRETTGYFTAFTNAVTQRLGCAPVAPAAGEGES
ncbi:hypothetical protein [Streptomyces sp. NPDC059063]|uniref:hypothetical protein n=1 Tax=unclassified Streptomyces TaxID=2593676 RepID=UPI0036977BFE